MDNEKSSNEMSFAEMFQEAESAGEHLSPGQKVKAAIVRIGREWVFLDLGGKSEGTLALAELLDEEGKPTVKEGDAIDVYFLGVERNEKVFTTKIGGSPGRAHLEDAWQSGIPVEGTVQKEIKGGFEVKIGGARAFCPFSQMGLHKIADNAEYIGRKLVFRIVEYKENGRNVIVSHRRILEEERQRQKEALRESLEVGQIVDGTVTSIRDFGVFVDIGGIEGLIPVSELAYGRVEDIHAVVEKGQPVRVMIKKLDWDNDRFSFSLRETMPDPWQSADLHEGTTVTGTVARLVDFGAFVTLAPGIDGLIHISHLGGGRRINHPREVVRQGQELEVRIDSIDREQKRISLSLPQQHEEEEKEEKTVRRRKNKPGREDAMADEYQRFRETRKDGKAASMGTFADLLKGRIDK